MLAIAFRLELLWRAFLGFGHLARSAPSGTPDVVGGAWQASRVCSSFLPEVSVSVWVESALS